MWWKILLVVAGGIVIVGAVVGLSARSAWRSENERLRALLTRGDELSGLMPPDSPNLQLLPRPVRRYLQAVLPDDYSAIRSVRIEHSGTFNMGQEEANWRPFTSVQNVVVHRPGFLWAAQIRIAAGVNAVVRDAYVNGRAELTARLASLFTVMEQEHSAELAQGELMRFLAETAWYPTALLPHDGLHWEAVDDSSARVTLRNGEVTVSLLFRFNSDGLIDSVYSDGRFRELDGLQVATPWEGRFWNYQERSGMLIPVDGEVSWLLPGGREPYWRGHIEEIHYETAP